MDTKGKEGSLTQITIPRSFFEKLAKYYQDRHCSVCDCQSNYLVLNQEMIRCVILVVLAVSQIRTRKSKV